MTRTALYSRLAMVLILCGMAFTLSHSAMRFVHVMHASSAAPQESFQATSRVSAAAIADIQTVANMPWFGSTPQQSFAAAVTQASPSVSPLELRGISRSGQSQLAGAYIAERGKKELYYRKGDALPGGAGALEDVYADHVTIRRGATLESLYFPDRRP